MAARKPLVLSYAGCSTCKRALRWLADRGVAVDVRPIVDEPPTKTELATWIPKSGRPVRKWLNTSGQSYRALGKTKMDAASDDELVAWLARDGKLVKRPVLVTSNRVLVGFDEAAYEDAFAG
jgi:arsenate reductase